MMQQPPIADYEKPETEGQTRRQQFRPGWMKPCPERPWKRRSDPTIRVAATAIRPIP